MREILIWTVKIVVSGGLLYLLLSRVDLARLWLVARTASVPWLAAALLLYFVMVLISAWRWQLLLAAQHVSARFGSLVNSFLVAGFFNYALPSNIGGDVIRIRDTARQAGSKTLATMVILVDRGIGLLGLVFVAAVGTTITAARSPAVGPIGPGLLWASLAVAIAMATFAVMMHDRFAALLRPLRVLHQEWVEERIERATTALAKFRDAPRALAGGLLGAICVQAVLVLFYATIARGLHMQVPLAHMAIVVPLSFVVQMAPVSIGGLGVREATFVLYLTPLGVPQEVSVTMSIIGILLTFFPGAIVYFLHRK